MSLSDMTGMGRVADAIAAVIVQRHYDRFSPSEDDRNHLRLHVAGLLEEAVAAADREYQEAIGVRIERPAPSREEMREQANTVARQVGKLFVRVRMCRECGSHQDAWIQRTATCHNCRPALATIEPTDLPIRALPEGFKHIDSPLLGGVTLNYLANLKRTLSDTRQIGIPLREVGGFRHNAELVASYVAEAAGYDPEEGRFDLAGSEPEGLLRWFADPEEGRGLATV